MSVPTSARYFEEEDKVWASFVLLSLLKRGQMHGFSRQSPDCEHRPRPDCAIAHGALRTHLAPSAGKKFPPFFFLLSSDLHFSMPSFFFFFYSAVIFS